MDYAAQARDAIAQTGGLNSLDNRFPIHWTGLTYIAEGTLWFGLSVMYSDDHNRHIVWVTAEGDIMESQQMRDIMQREHGVGTIA